MKIAGGHPWPRMGGLPSGPTPSRVSPGEACEASDLVALGPGGAPLRSSASMPRWLADYERALGVGEEALALRREALREEGPLMLYRMFPQLFREDLQGPYRQLSQLLPGPAPRLWLAGDAHVGNFGTVRKPSGEVIWTLNDYDQGGKGRADYDLCRAGASLALLGRVEGWSEEECERVVSALGRHYARGIRDFAQHSPSSSLGVKASEAREPLLKLIQKAEKKTQAELLSKWATLGSEGYRFQFDDQLRELTPSQRKHLDALLKKFDLRGARILDRGVRLDAGGSSMGLERFYLLVQKGQQELPRLLEVKHVLPSALLAESPEPSGCDAEKLKASFKQLGAPGDPWMDIARDRDGVYLLRERQSAKDSLKLGKLSVDEAENVARHMGRLLAQAHAMQGKAEELKDWVGDRSQRLQTALAEFSRVYAGQVVQDHQALSDAR